MNEYTYKYRMRDQITRLINSLNGAVYGLERMLEEIGAPAEHEFDETPVEELTVGIRAKNCLHNIGLKTISQVSAMSDRELLTTPNFGKKSLYELRAAIERHRTSKDSQND